MTDYELDKRAEPKIPEWIYFALFYVVLGCFALSLASPLIVGVIGIARGIW